MKLKATVTTSADTAEMWGSEPNVRADIKMDIAMQLARMMRTNDAIEWSWRIDDAGEFEVTGTIDLQKSTVET